MQINRRLFTEMLAGLGLTAAAATPALAQGAVVEVSMQNAPIALFDPPSVTIKVGDTVRWTNPGVITHTVTFDPSKATKAADVALPGGVAPFDSGDMEQDGEFKHTFTVKGSYKYVCKYHEAMGMVGTVVVS
jgi:plastocyanin